MPYKTVVIFDGMCNLCARSVQFILKYESAPTLRFASMQSGTGGRLMLERGIDPQDTNTFVLIKNGQAYVRSGAAIQLATHLRMPWRLLGVLRIFPRSWMDWGYNLIARNRYRWFGHRAVCMLPDSTHLQRFLG